ncbi:hypothetical protein Xvtw_03175 [Xanthomonas campestris pv. vitiswoodrowii]|nr:hypothetical protein Xvtw_03175 [Xanthomonas campestris pv. vitiswoodrowii]
MPHGSINLSKAQSIALSAWLGSEVSIEQTVPHFRCNPFSAIDDQQRDVISSPAMQICIGLFKRCSWKIV